MTRNAALGPPLTVTHASVPTSPSQPVLMALHPLLIQTGQEVVHPKCDEGYTLNPDDCVCKIRVVPDCPKNTYLWPRNARCVGTDDPYCPKGFTKVGCKCVRDDERVCESGKLTANYCKCKNVYPPTCTGDGCSLNTNDQCTCERDGKCVTAYTT